ncbi:trimeric intracellular cation channel family protein [Thalassotalea aquiviva]|uniref:trimeric intracellular cation channel family protein n=1 Tax=Thalassotalea aquiviva TaxID=3242415 RepID=UPI003529EE0F
MLFQTLSVSAFVYLIDILGVIVFAISGALVAGRYRLDPFGVIVLASVTAVGGGTLRDVILGLPVFWTLNSEYIVVIVLTALCTIVLVRQPKLVPRRSLLVADAFGLVFFAVLGAQKALVYEHDFITAVIMGTITGVVGGMLRDIICNRIPLILQEEIYAVAAIVCATLYVGLIKIGLAEPLAGVVAIIVGLLLRLAGIYWKISLPAFHFDDDPQDSK